MTTCMQTMMAMMKEMQAEKEERMKLQDQICKQQEQMSELIPKVGNNNNNRININVFLNENCKDAINMSEFLEGIKVNPKVFEAVKRALFILLFDAMINHIIPTINKPGIATAITFSIIEF